MPNRNAIKKWGKYSVYREILERTKTLNTYDLKNEKDLDCYIREQENYLTSLKAIKDSFQDEYRSRIKEAVAKREERAKKSISKKIKQVMAEKGINQTELAMWIGVSATTVSQMCANDGYYMNLPPLKDVLAIYDVLGITPNELLGISEVEK